MSQPSSHYQVSFTAKQALALFIGLLALSGLSYFFGLMTGLSGNEPAAGATAGTPAVGEPDGSSPSSPAAVPAGETGENLAFPAPVTAVPSAGGPAPPPPPAKVQKVQVFEDGEGAPRPPRPAATPRPRPAPGGFRVQVLSVSSRADAEGEAARLTRAGLAASVEPGTGPRGTVYRVRVGPYSTREEAEEATRRLSSQGRRDTWIVPPGQ